MTRSFVIVLFILVLISIPVGLVIHWLVPAEYVQVVAVAVGGSMGITVTLLMWRP